MSAADPQPPRMTPLDVEMLRHIAAGDVTFRQEYRRRGSIESYRLWSSEHDYRIVTRRVARLIKARLAETDHGYQFGRGAVEPTSAGRALLRETAEARGE